MTINETKTNHKKTVREAVNAILTNSSWRANWTIGVNNLGYLIEVCGNQERLRAYIPNVVDGKYIESIGLHHKLKTGYVEIAKECTWNCNPLEKGESWQDLEKFILHLENIDLESYGRN